MPAYSASLSRPLSLSLLYLSIHLSIYHLSISFTRWKATLESRQSGTRYLFDAIFSLPISRRCNGRLCADEASRDSLLSVINEPGDCRCLMNKAIDRFRRRSPRDILLRTLTLLLCSTFHRPYTVSPPSETENSNKSLDIVTQFPFTVSRTLVNFFLVFFSSSTKVYRSLVVCLTMSRHDDSIHRQARKSSRYQPVTMVTDS